MLVLAGCQPQRDALERLELETDLRERGADWPAASCDQISPAQFIPIAEESGLIERLGIWALEEACRQTVFWQQSLDSEQPPVISVNLSGRQLQDPNLVDEIRRVLQETGLEPRLLKLEVTEGVLMLDLQSTIARMQALTEIGIRLAIDDFGTGYSSLSYLKQFPVDTLKIDRSFVEGLGTDPQALAIVRSIVALAESLDLSVTAEGVETAAHRAQLGELGCDRGQGVLFRQTAGTG